MRAVFGVLVGVLAAYPASAQTQRSFSLLEDTTRVRVAVYADGNLKNALGQDGGGQLAAASLGLGIGLKNFSVDLLVNTIGTADPVSENFGTTLLAPASGSSLSAGLLEVRYLPAAQVSGNDVFGIGGRFYSTISSAEWQVRADEELPVGVVVAGFGVGGFATLFGRMGDGEEDSNPIGALLDAGIAVRALGGDIANDENREQLDIAVPGAQKVRVGLEIGLQLQIRGAKASLTYYSFGGMLGGDDVPGLTRGQVVAGFSVQSPLFQGYLSAGRVQRGS